VTAMLGVISWYW